MIYIFLIYVLEFRYLLKSSFYDHNILSLYRSNFSNSISQVRICEKILFSESFLPPPPLPKADCLVATRFKDRQRVPLALLERPLVCCTN